MKHSRIHFSAIVRLAAVLLSGAARVAAQSPGEPPVPPNFAISQIQDAYGEGKHYVQFPTQAGFHYTVEQSMDLLSWQTAEGGYFYGNGSAKQFYVMQIPPPAPPPSVPGVPPGQWLPRMQKQYFFHDAYLYINKSGGPEAILSDCKGSGGNFQVWYNVIQASAATPPQSAFPSRNQTHIYHFDMENAAEVHSVTLVVMPLPSATFSGMPSTPGPVVGSAEAAFSAMIVAELPQVISALTVPEVAQVDTESHMATVFVPAAGGSQAVARIIRPEPVPVGLPREWFVLLNASFPARSKSIFTRFVWPEPPPALLEHEVTLTLKPLAAAAFASLLAAVDANQDGIADAGPSATQPEPKLRDLLVAHSGEIATAQSSTDVSRYYRVRRRATDSNLNGLPDWFEFWASYNPFAQAGAADFMNPGDDPDGDGLTNLEELNAGLNPTAWDTDGDNQPDGAEVDAGTDPTQPNGVEEPTLVVHQTGIIQPCDGPHRPFVRHIMSTTSVDVGWRRVWEPAAISAYFSSPPQDGEERTFTSQMKMLFPPDGPRAALVPISFSMATDCSQEVFDAPEDLENPVTVLTFSPVPGTDASAEQSWSNAAGGEDPMMFVANVAPPEIVDAEMNKITELKVAKLSANGVLTPGNNNATSIDTTKEPDRFHVLLRKTTGLWKPSDPLFGKLWVKVGTTNPDPDYDDDASEIALPLTTVNGASVARSRPQILVSNAVDDLDPIDGGADDAPSGTPAGYAGDQSHRCQLGGKFVISEIKVGSDPWKAVKSETKIPVRKKVNLTAVLVRSKALTDGGISYTKAQVEQVWKKANEYYGQVGIKVIADVQEPMDPPQGVDLSNGLLVRNPNDSTVLKQEVKDLIAAGGTTSTVQDIHVFHVAGTIVTQTLPLADHRGSSISDFYYDESEEIYTYNAFVQQLGGDMDRIAAVSAHELGHLLTDAGHDDEEGEFAAWHIMYGGQLTVASVMGSKRFKLTDENKMYQNTHVKAP